MMPETGNSEDDARKARVRALIVPREHGAWGLLLIPLFTGVAAGLRSAQHYWPIPVFVLVALALFWLRTPVESLLGSSPMTARTPEERRTAFVASAALAAATGACLIVLVWGGRNVRLLLIGTIAAGAFVVQTLVRKLGRDARMASQLIGAIGLTATAPAAYYLATGWFDEQVLALWAANWLFAWNQIHFVQMRIHGTRARTFRDKFVVGWVFFFGQTVLVAVLIAALLSRRIPPLVMVAFAPMLIRGLIWFFQAPQPLNVKKLGWSEMKLGAASGVLLALAFVIR